MTADPRKFFREPIFEKLAAELWRRWWLKGTFGTSVGLTQFVGLDTQPLRRLLGETVLAWEQKKRFSINEFAEALQSSALNWQVVDFVTYLTKKPLMLKGEQLAKEEIIYQEFCRDIKGIDPLFVKLLTPRMIKEWQQKELLDLTIFRQVALALEALKDQAEFLRLPVFAYQVTGNPHAFDNDDKHPAGQLLMQMLKELSHRTPEELSGLEKAEKDHGLLAEFQLLKDDVKNYAAIYGLTADLTEGHENQMWRQACQEQVSWNVPLKEILRQTSIRPVSGEKVLVVENSGVYSILVELLPEVPIVCSSGQFTFAIWQLLRKLTAAGTQLYYSGDLDPEGLGMAQKLKTTFGHQLAFIGINRSLFLLGKTEQPLSEVRLKKLRLLNDPRLVQLGETIRETKAIAYQEGFLRELIQEVQWEFA